MAADYLISFISIFDITIECVNPTRLFQSVQKQIKVPNEGEIEAPDHISYLKIV